MMTAKILPPKAAVKGKFIETARHPKPARIAQTLRTVEEVELALPLIAKYILAPKEKDIYAVRFNSKTGAPEDTVSHALPSPKKPFCVPKPDSPVTATAKVHRKVARDLFQLVKSERRTVISTGQHEMVLEPWYENMNYGHTMGPPEMRLVGTKVYVADWVHVDILPDFIQAQGEEQ